MSTDHLPDKGSKFLRALASIQAADYKHADALLSDLYKQESENIWYSIAFAVNLEHLGREPEAELVYRRLLDIFPGDYVLSMRLLGLLKLAGRYQSALVIARRLENEFPEKQQVYFELSEIYQSLHRPALQMMAEAEFHRITGNSRASDKALRSDPCFKGRRSRHGVKGTGKTPDVVGTIKPFVVRFLATIRGIF